MPDAHSLIPEITDSDIEWVRDLMGLDALDEPRREFMRASHTLDVAACPGSGKTTLVVAKLAILARKWPYHLRGICVLSHTNVAREEIQHRLGNTVVGQRLLGYPHFIDTIHGFANRFLALPWLNSNGYPPPTIDNEVTTAYRRRELGNKYWTVQNALTPKHSDFARLRIRARDLSFGLGDKPFPHKPHTPSFQLSQQAIESAAKAGYFCYDEMFVWAHALLEDCPNVASWLRRRFPLVLLDEMQDTQELQGRLLHAVFPRTSTDIAVQRVGDPNQAIFDSTQGEPDTSAPFPDPDATRNLSIPNSYRFGHVIAGLATPLAIEKVGTSGLVGLGPKAPADWPTEGTHTIFIFPDDSTTGVLDAFGAHVLATFPDEALVQGAIAAVGAIHKDEPLVQPGDSKFPMAVPNYWGGYSAGMARKDPNPKSLLEYVRLAQETGKNTADLAPGVAKLASGIARLASTIGVIRRFKQKAHPHRSIVNLLEAHPEVLATYRGLVRSVVVNRIPLTQGRWKEICSNAIAVAVVLCEGDIKPSSADGFLAWQDNVRCTSASIGSPSMEAGPNVYRATNGARHVDIKLGSIHSVKGQTHLATLILHTYWNDPSSQRILPWLLGNKVNGSGAGKQDRKRLLQHYVAMTRPSHMVCFAMPQSALGEATVQVQNLGILRARGWQIIEVQPAVECLSDHCSSSPAGDLGLLNNQNTHTLLV